MNEFLYENPNSRNKFYRHLPKISTVYYCVWTSYPLLYYHRVSFIKIHGTKLSIMIKQQAERDTQRLLWFWWEGQKLIPVKKIEWNWMWMTSAAWNELKLQVRETFSYTIDEFNCQGESAAELFFFSSRGHASCWSGTFKPWNPLVFWGWCLILDLV